MCTLSGTREYLRVRDCAQLEPSKQKCEGRAKGGERSSLSLLHAKVVQLVCLESLNRSPYVSSICNAKKCKGWPSFARLVT